MSVYIYIRAGGGTPRPAPTPRTIASAAVPLFSGLPPCAALGVSSHAL